MSDYPKPKGRPKKERPKLAEVPQQFTPNEEFGLTEMQTAFVWHYAHGGCGQTEAARRAGFTYPAMSASKLMNGRDHPHVVKAIRAEQEDLFTARACCQHHAFGNAELHLARCQDAAEVRDHAREDWPDVMEDRGDELRERRVQRSGERG